jgi:2-keto-4-pentenoate hydratase/2-oxohepta-3-ene-1,7-dioic acid hydratase in catechol pathway
MKLHLGLLEGSAPTQARIFGEVDGKLVDLQLSYAGYLAHSHGNRASAYDLAAFYLPQSIALFLERGEAGRTAANEAASFAHRSGARNLHGPGGEKVVYNPEELRLLPPFQNPEKSFVIGFSDRARTEALPKAEVPTGYCKLPQTFIASGTPILWPRFSEELDADACLALIIGKAGRRIEPADAWNYIAGVTLLIDITARDINKREGLTTNNLLGKNFPSSTSLGPAVFLKPNRKTLEGLEVKLTIDGELKQEFRLTDCVFTVEQIIARWSILGVKPGDFFAIGASMAIRGERLQNPAALKIGSAVRCSSPLIGELCHVVVSAGGVRR